MTTTIPLRERELQNAVISLARMRGWRVAHFLPHGTGKNRGTWRTPVQADGAGYPDLTLVRGDRLLFVELKQDGKYPNPKQRAWLDALEATPAEVYVWRPADWYAGRVESVLS